MNWLIKTVTRPSTIGPGGTTIDNILTDSKYVAMSGVLPDLLSDHHPVYAVRKKRKEFFERITVKARIYKNYNGKNFKEFLL